MVCRTPGLPVFHQFLELAQSHVHWVSETIWPFYPLLSLLLLLSIFPSIRVFSNELALCIRWPECWSFSFSPSNEYSGLVSFRTDCVDLLPVQGALKSLLQHYSSKPSIIWHSAFFMVQFSLSYMTSGKTIALSMWTFFGKVISLLYNRLSQFVISFLPRTKHLLIYGCNHRPQWFWSPRK